MDQKLRLQNLLDVLQKRDPKTKGLAERIERVKAELGVVSLQVHPIKDEPKKKIKKTVEIEVDA